MKKTIILLVTVFLASCSSSESPLEKWIVENGKIKVLSTTAMIDDLVGYIGAEWVDHLTLIVGEIDPHTYELVKGDDEKLKFAQVIFSNGLNLEHGASLRYHLQNHSNVVAIGNEIMKKYPESIIFVNGDLDPHIWMDISLWMKGIDLIVDHLSRLDPLHQAEFQENGEKLRLEMKQVDEKICALLQQIPTQKRFLVTSHDAFNYFARHYLADQNEKSEKTWQKRFAAPEGLAPDGQLSTNDIQQIIDHLRRYNIQILFPESNVSKDSLRKILDASHQLGINVRMSNQCLYGDATGGPLSNAETYLKMIEHNAFLMYKEWNN